MINLKHSKRSITKSFTKKVAEKELRTAIDKSKRGFKLKDFSHWQLPEDSGYKFDNGSLIEVKRKQRETESK